MDQATPRMASEDFMTTRITGPTGEMLYGVYYPPRVHLTLGEHGEVIASRPASTWETTRWQIRQLVRRLFP